MAERTRGEDLMRRLIEGLRLEASALRVGARNLPVLFNLSKAGSAKGPYENIVSEATSILGQSERIYKYNNSYYMESNHPLQRTLIALTTGEKVEATASGHLANIFICEEQPLSEGDLPTQFPPPFGFLQVLFASERTRDTVSEISQYSRLPLFDEHFVLQLSGYHRDSGCLIHSPEIVPNECALPAPDASSFDQIPPRLRRLLRGFSFREHADLANTIALLLSGVLANHFIDAGKPIFLLDGNQPGVGKTLLASVVAVLLEGNSPALIDYSSNEEELRKRICTVCKDPQAKLLIFDNAKTAVGGGIESAVIESTSGAPRITFRLLGSNTALNRPNDLLWLITMNSTRTSPDIASRGVPIRFHYDGDPANRTFPDGDLISFAKTNRLEILAELYGLVTRFQQDGCLQSDDSHRYSQWAKTIGGVLRANNIQGFLQNVHQASLEFDQSLDQVTRLAEMALRSEEDGFIETFGGANEAGPRGRAPAQWRNLFELAGGVPRDGVTRSNQGTAVVLGQFLGAHLGKSVGIEHSDRKGTATLCRIEGRSRTKLYYFHIKWDDTEDHEEGSGDAQRESMEEAGVRGQGVPSPASALEDEGNDEDW